MTHGVVNITLALTVWKMQCFEVSDKGVWRTALTTLGQLNIFATTKICLGVKMNCGTISGG
jgi:hypothetical protein